MTERPERLLNWLKLLPPHTPLSAAFGMWRNATTVHGLNRFATVREPRNGRYLHFGNMGFSRDGWDTMVDGQEDDDGLFRLNDHGHSALACAKVGDYVASLEREVLRVLEIVDRGPDTVKFGPTSVLLRKADLCPTGTWSTFHTEKVGLPLFLTVEGLAEGRRLGSRYAGEEVAIPGADTRLSLAQGADADAMSWVCGFVEGVLPMWLESIELRACARRSGTK